MTHAYNEFYLNDAKSSLSAFFDYMINACGYRADWAASLFITTGYAHQFERGNPSILSGMSGIELAHAVIAKTYANKKPPKADQKDDCSPEYWAGWALAEYQWFSGRNFKDIFERIPLSQIIEMYSVYHEMDISQFIESMEKFYREAVMENP